MSIRNTHGPLFETVFSFDYPIMVRSCERVSKGLICDWFLDVTRRKDEIFASYSNANARSVTAVIDVLETYALLCMFLSDVEDGAICFS